MRKILFAVASLFALAGSAMADQTKDFTLVLKCDDIVYSTGIEVFSRQDTLGHCREMEKVLEGVRVEDIRSFEKAAYVLSKGGYKEGQYDQIVSELVDIVRLRGLYNQPDRWLPTINVVYKSWVGLKGDVSPAAIRAFLGSAGKMAKALSDDGLVSMIVMMHIQHQDGD